MIELKAIRLDVSFEDEVAKVELEYERVQSVGEEAEMKHMFQYRWRNERGVVVPIEQIGVKPKAGEIFPSRVYFQVKEGEELYVGLWGVHQDNPNALVFAKRNLEFLKDNFARERQINLLDWRIERLNRIINPEGELPEGIRGFLKGRLRSQTQLERPYLED